MRFLIYPVVGAILLGAFGLAAGVVGPIVWNPGANQGPLVGIFVTGPWGAVVGFAAGLVLAFFRPNPKPRP